jgi:hypothetical protein
MRLNTPYLQIQGIRRQYRERGLFTFPRPFTYVSLADFTTPGAAAAGEVARTRLTIDSDSDFIWTRASWYAQDVPFNPPQSMSLNTENSTWASTRSANFEVAFKDMRSGRIWHEPLFIEPTDFSGWIGADAAGSVLEQTNGAIILAVAGNDTGIGHVPHPFLEPVILPASCQFEISVRNRSAGASIFSSHLFSFHGVRLYKLN